jgi:hypothetical protein
MRDGGTLSSGAESDDAGLVDSALSPEQIAAVATALTGMILAAVKLVKVLRGLDESAV